MKTHTAGPWAYDGIRVYAPAADETYLVRLADGTEAEHRRGLIALVYSCGGGSADANACLITLAPELVGCCRELLAVIDRHLDQESLAAVVARMRAVVAKADGLAQAVTPADATAALTTGMRCDHKFIDSTHCLKCGWTP